MTIRAAPDGTVRRTRATVADHVAAELTSDPDRIAATISRDAFFPVLVRTPGGVDFRVLTSREDIREYYRRRLGTFEILDTIRVLEHRTEWYALHESVATVRHVGEFNGVPATGREHRVHSVVLFPTDDDGIVGELEWTRFDFADIFRGEVGPPAPTTGPDAHLPLRRVTLATALDRLVDALAIGDAPSVLAEMVDTPRWAARHMEPCSPVPGVVEATGAEVVSEYVTAFGLASDVVVLSRHVDDWFVFAELGLNWNGAAVRMIVLLPVARSGRFVAALAYAVAAGD